jgi:cystathionine gamma-synthase
VELYGLKQGGTTRQRPFYIRRGAFFILEKKKRKIKMTENRRHVSLETELAQAGNRSDEDNTKSISAPLYFSTAFRHDELNSELGPCDYSRVATPTRTILEDVLAKLEHGVQAFALSSGMAAIQLVFSQFKTGDLIITSNDLYGGSFRFFDQLTSHYGIRFELWDGHDDAALRKLCAEKPKALWIETPSNPTMKVIDIHKAAETVHEFGAQLIVDNTFYTPLLQQPLVEGADIVVHSATKFLGGHNDLLAGAVMVREQKLADELAENFITTGTNLAPFDCWLLLRSLKTLPLRLRQQEANAQGLVKVLTASDQVEKVLYPGHGGMISFYINPAIDVEQFLLKLQVISFAESLGGVESLITVPALRTHAEMPETQRLALGITPNLLRLSVGVEALTDLSEDLKQALAE